LHGLGKLLRITAAARIELKLWLIRPCDMPWPQLQHEAGERRRANEAERQRKERRKRRE
jgi:hypothetical protein